MSSKLLGTFRFLFNAIDSTRIKQNPKRVIRGEYAYGASAYGHTLECVWPYVRARMAIR